MAVVALLGESGDGGGGSVGDGDGVEPEEEPEEEEPDAEEPDAEEPEEEEPDAEEAEEEEPEEEPEDVEPDAEEPDAEEPEVVNRPELQHELPCAETHAQVTPKLQSPIIDVSHVHAVDWPGHVTWASARPSGQSRRTKATRIMSEPIPNRLRTSLQG